MAASWASGATLSVHELRRHSIEVSSSSPSAHNFGSLAAAQSRILQHGQTISEAKEELRSLRKSGCVEKRGFRYFKAWRLRGVILAGRLLKYYDLGAAAGSRNVGLLLESERPRGVLELTKDTVVEAHGTCELRVLPASSPRPLSVLPPDRGRSSTVDAAALAAAQEEAAGRHGEDWASALWALFRRADNTGLPWRLRAPSTAVRDDWAAAIERVVALINRIEVPPTLSGMGELFDSYDLGKVLGRGKFGDVRLATAKHTGAAYACKIIDKRLMRSDLDARELRKEIRVCRRVTRCVNHPHVAKLYQAFEGGTKVYLVNECLGGGSLLDSVARRGYYSERGSALVLTQLAGALAALHEIGVVVVELHPRNLLYEQRWRGEIPRLKICDFGRAVLLPSGTQRDRFVTLPLSARCELEYATPEFYASRIVSQATDLWALGCILHLLLCGEPAFEGGTQLLRERIARGMLAARACAHTSHGARALLARLLTTDPHTRATAAEVLRDDWALRPPANALTTKESKPPSARRRHSDERRAQDEKEHVRIFGHRWSLPNLKLLEERCAPTGAYARAETMAAEAREEGGGVREASRLALDALLPRRWQGADERQQQCAGYFLRTLQSRLAAEVRFLRESSKI